MLCESHDQNCGAMWECPLLLELNTVPANPGRQSQDAVNELSKSFNNMRAFQEASNSDTAKSASAIAANDPRDASKHVCNFSFI